jgi:hypothetical protein
VQAASSSAAAPVRANLRAEANQFLLDVVIVRLRRETSATAGGRANGGATESHLSG